MWNTIKSYIFWTHKRAGFHYDVMVTLILLFIFLTPRTFFKDKPIQHTPHQSEVVVAPEGDTGFVYEVDGSAVPEGANDEAVREALLRVIEPISGEVEISKWEKVKDARGRVTAYKVHVER
ncbi:MAG TPA: hypothetical protein VKW78_19865 [Terriglobales bacterium]|nr:hypothetical protein [Terriglobales bacterium]